MLNRVASTRFPDNVRAVIDQKNQFEPIQKTASQSVAGLPAQTSRDREAISAIIKEMSAGALSNPTRGATFFQNVAITDERGTNFASGFEPLVVIGRHSFYDRFKANDPVKVARWRVTTPMSRAVGSSPAPSAGVII